MSRLPRISLTLNSSSDALAMADKHLNQLVTMFTEKELLRVMHQTTIEMVPDVRAALQYSFNQSGVQDVTGKLRRVVATDAVITAGPFGFRCEYGPKINYTKEEGGGNIYASASSKKYGAIYGKGGAKLSAGLKKKLLATPGAVRHSAPIPDFFEFLPASIKHLADLFKNKMQVKLQAKLQKTRAA